MKIDQPDIYDGLHIPPIDAIGSVQSALHKAMERCRYFGEARRVLEIFAEEIDAIRDKR